MSTPSLVLSGALAIVLFLPTGCSDPGNPGDEEICGDDLDNDGIADNADRDGDSFLSDACGGQDCDDQDPDTHPGQPESCDQADNDCDGEIDNGFDADDDSWTSCGGDCDSTDPLINPDAEEICDGIDNDCDDEIDEGYDPDSCEPLD